MKVVVVYREESDHARSVIDFRRDYERQTGRELEAIDPDQAEGANFCRTYDIVEYPTVVAISAQGGMQNMWRGLPLPLINELSYYDNAE